MGFKFSEQMQNTIEEIDLGSIAISVSPKTTLREAVEKLKTIQVGSLVICEDDQVVGIFTERDFLMKLAGTRVSLSKEKIGDYMTSDPVCVQGNTPIRTVLEQMRDGNFRHIISVDKNNRLKKIISIKDITNYIVEVLANLPAEEFDDTDEISAALKLIA